jgi:hypothetical protein
MKNFREFLEAMATPGGNLLILVCLDFALLFLMGNKWFHYSDQIDSEVDTMFAAAMGATIQALQSGVRTIGSGHPPESKTAPGSEKPGADSV